MAKNNTDTPVINTLPGWSEFRLKEDWWAVWLGLGIVIAAYLFYITGSSISWIAVALAKWSSLPQLTADLTKNALRYVALFAALLVLFTIVISFTGQKPKDKNEKAN